ncbi:MAG: bacillithiol biosynthesis BshC, partial [Chitinophagaceae bacterium]
LVVLDPDVADLKRGFIPAMKEDLLQHTSLALAEKSIAELAEQHYKSQAFPRPINLFYLKENLRERIEKVGEAWEVLGTDIRWNEAELLAELEEHPERFSPNVIFRPVFQEFILPDIAFIGGGSEVAYWMQLKRVFEHHHVFFPVIYLRQSLALLSKRDAGLLAQTGMSLEDVFAPAFEAQKMFVALHATKDFQLSNERLELEKLMQALGRRAEAIDQTLSRSAAAALAKMKNQLDALEKKMLRAEKKKQSIGLERLSRLQASLFPGGGLQERVENFMPYYLEFGPTFFDDILKEIRPFDNQFLVLAE